MSAWGGVFGLATGVLDLGHELNHRLPLHSPVFGALGLAIFVGIPATALAWHAARGDERIGATAVFAGMALIGWIAVELAFIRELSWLQLVYVAVGTSFIVISQHAVAPPALDTAAPRTAPRIE